MLLRRRPLAALCVGLGVLVALRQLAGPPAPTTPVVVAAHDLPAGAVLSRADLMVRDFAASTAPSAVTALDDAVGRTLATPLSRGEPATASRLVAPGWLAGYPGLVAVPVRIPDSDAVGMLRVGDRIDLLATDPGRAGGPADPGGTRLVATGVPVLALPAPPSGLSGLPANSPASGRLVVVGTTREGAENVTDASVRLFLTVVWSS